MIVLDSSFLIAFHNSRDVHHAAARRIMEDLIDGRWGRAILLEYVFVEVVTVLLARRGLDVAARAGSILLEAAEVDFLPCSELFPDAWTTFREQDNRDLSLTDAAIVAVARSRSDAAVATFDTDLHGLAGVTVVPE